MAVEQDLIQDLLAVPISVFVQVEHSELHKSLVEKMVAEEFVEFLDLIQFSLSLN